MILSSNCLIIKNTYLSAQSADIIRTGKHEISNESINFDRLKWQIDGNTVLHHFALDYERLSLILNYMEEKSPQYLSMILMTNKRGKTPLDITLDNESPKNTEALLRKLIIFKDHRLSQLYYKRFKDLFNMNITAFHDCLEACFFQTTQMKSIKYLKLRDKSLPVCVPHISAIIDETFVDKYWVKDEKHIIELEKKIREEEEERRKASQPKVGNVEQQLVENEEEDKEVREENKEGFNRVHENDDAFEEALGEQQDTSVARVKSKAEIELLNERRKQKRIDIQAIEFDWIFNNTEGRAFMNTLAYNKDIGLYSLSIVRYIIKFCWSYYRIYIVCYLLIPFLIYFALFIFYATYIHKRVVETDHGPWEGFGCANSLSIIFLFLFIAYFSFFEIRQMKLMKWSYLSSFWNMVDLASLLLNLAVLI